MSLAFDRISAIQPDIEESWRHKVFLTIDIDWACDEVLADTIDLVEEAGVAATWFVTHHTPLLERLRANPNFELGIHPNFNPLLRGEESPGVTFEGVVDRLLAIVPEARSVRSHSMAQSSPLLHYLAARGITHDCNLFIPEHAGIELGPWRDWTGLIRVPYFWEDDIACAFTPSATPADLKNRPGLRVFDFHPIHVFLNTESLDRYEKARACFHDPERLLRLRYRDGAGTRTLFTHLIGAAK